MSKISLAFLSSFIGKNLTEEEFEKLDVEKVLTETLNDKLKAAKKDGWDEAASKAKKEILSDAEKRISEALGVEKGTIETMVSEYEAKKRDKIDDEAIKNSQVFKDAIKKLSDKLVEQEKNFNQIIDGYKSKEIDSIFISKMSEIATAQKWNLQKQDQIELLASYVKSNFNILYEDGKISIKTKDGKEVRDDYQNVLDFEKVIINTGSKFFDVVQSDGRQAPNNKGLPPRGANSDTGVDPFKSIDDYVSRVSLESDPAKLAAMKTQYESQIQEGKFISN